MIEQSYEITYDSSLLATESFLQITCEEYYIDYNTMQEKPIPLQEGVIGTVIEWIKTLFQKLIKGIVAIFKWIIDKIKALYNWVKEKITGKKSENNNSKAKPVTVSFTTGSGVKSTTAKNGAEVSAAYQQSLAMISQNIDKLSKQNINYVKMSENKATQEANKAARMESMIPLEEKVVYNNHAVSSSIKNATNTANNKFSKSDTKYDSNDIREAINLITGKDPDDDKDGVFQSDSALGDKLLTTTEYISNESLKAIKNAQDNVEAVYTQMVHGVIEIDVNKVLNAYKGLDDAYAKASDAAKKIKEMMDKDIKFDSENEEHVNLKDSFYSAIEKISSAMGRLVTHESVEEDNNFNMVLRQSAKIAAGLKMNYNLSDNDLKQVLISSVTPSFLDENGNFDKQKCQRWASLKLNWNKSMIRVLRESLRLNKEAYTIGECSLMDTLYNMSVNGDDKLTLQLAKQIIAEKINTFKTSFGLDFRKVGLGVILITKEVLESDENSYLRSNALDPRKSDRIINYITKYDVTVISHGDEFDDSTANHIEEGEKYGFDIDDEYSDEYANEIKAVKAAKAKGDISRRFVKSSSRNKSYETNKYDEDDKGYWTMLPISSIGGGSYREMTSLLDNLINNKDKYFPNKKGKRLRINIIVCNPGHFELPKRFLQSRAALIRMSTDSTLG